MCNENTDSLTLTYAEKEVIKSSTTGTGHPEHLLGLVLLSLSPVLCQYSSIDFNAVLAVENFSNSAESVLLHLTWILKLFLKELHF